MVEDRGPKWCWNLKPRCQLGWFLPEASEKNRVLASSSFWWLPMLPGLWPHHPNLCSVALPSLLYWNLPLSLSYKDTCGYIWRRSWQALHIQILNLITRARFFLPYNNYKIQESRHGCLWRQLFSIPQASWPLGSLVLPRWTICTSRYCWNVFTPPPPPRPRLHIFLSVNSAAI